MSRIPIRTDDPLRGIPWMNSALIVANILVFAAQQSDLGRSLMEQYVLDSRALRLSRFISYAFLHLNVLHLLVNVTVLYAFGNNVNDRLGQGGYLAFYLAGAVAAGIGFIVSGGDRLAGASGAVGAVMGACLALLPDSRLVLDALGRALRVRSLYLLLIFFAYNVVAGVTFRSPEQQVAYTAHIAGMLFGFVVALLLLGVRLVDRSPLDLPAMLWRGFGGAPPLKNFEAAPGRDHCAELMGQKLPE